MRGMVNLGKAAALGVACVLATPPSAAGQARAGVVTTLQGTATVARATAPPAPLRFKDDVFGRDHIVTGESSIVRILLGGKAVVTVRERSALTIHETPTTSTIDIDAGKMALAVAKDRMKPGESVQIRTPNAMAGVRGTVVIAEVTPPAEPGGSLTTRFTLLTGLVDVARLDVATGQAAGQTTLHPLHTIVVTGGLPPSAAQAISTTEAQSIAADYKVALPPPPPPANTQVTEQQIDIAVQHSAALTGAGGGTLLGGTASVGGTLAVGANVTAGDGTLGASANLAVGGGTLGASTNLTVGGGTLGAGGGLNVGGLGVGGNVTVGGGDLGAGISLPGGGGVTVGGSGTGSGGGTGGGLIGGLVPTVLPLR